MIKTLLASAVALSLCITSSASAITVNVTSMVLGSTNSATGTLSSIANSSSYTPYGSLAGIFFSQPWDAWAVEYFDDTSGATLHFDGTVFGWGDFDYTFTLPEGRVAWGMWINWSMSTDIPILNIMDCGAGNPGDICTGIGTPMQYGPFPGLDISFNGVVAPVPTAFWLFGSGLLGLIGVARKKK